MKKTLTVHYTPLGRGEFIVIKRGNKERWYAYTPERSERLILATYEMPTEYYPEKMVTTVN